MIKIITRTLLHILLIPLVILVFIPAIIIKIIDNALDRLEDLDQ